MKKLLFIVMLSHLFAGEWQSFDDLERPDRGKNESHLNAELYKISSSIIAFTIEIMKPTELTGNFEELSHDLQVKTPLVKSQGIFLNNGGMLAGLNGSGLDSLVREDQDTKNRLILNLRIPKKFEPTNYATTSVQTYQNVVSEAFTFSVFNQRYNRSYLYLHHIFEDQGQFTMDQFAASHADKHSKDRRSLLKNFDNFNIEDDLFIREDNLHNVKFKNISGWLSRNSMYESRINNLFVFVDIEGNRYKVENLNMNSILEYSRIDGSLKVMANQFHSLQGEPLELDKTKMLVDGVEEIMIDDLKHLMVFVCNSGDPKASMRCLFAGFTNNKIDKGVLTIFTPMIISNELLKHVIK